MPIGSCDQATAWARTGAWFAQFGDDLIQPGLGILGAAFDRHQAIFAAELEGGKVGLLLQLGRIQSSDLSTVAPLLLLLNSDRSLTRGFALSLDRDQLLLTARRQLPSDCEDVASVLEATAGFLESCTTLLESVAGHLDPALEHDLPQDPLWT